ncbi:MAG: hypothetical protein CL693_04835 [Cellvibrionaceae bacterium]|nr:hypothetical protein [Cellvibrionaceae bacterium]
MTDNVPSSVLEGMASLIEAAGQDPVTVAEAIGLNSEALYRSDILISEIKVNDLLEEAALACNDRFFGLHSGQLKRFDTLGPIWLLARNANTIGEGLMQVAQNLAVHSQGLSVTTEDDQQGSGMLIGFELVRLTSGGADATFKHTGFIQIIEHAMSIMCQELRCSLGEKWRPQFAQFRHAKPDNLAPLQQVFGPHLFFNQDVNAIQIYQADVLAPNSRNARRIVSREAKQLLKRSLESTIGHGEGFVQRVSRIIRTLLNDQGVSANDVAETLGVPLRTLQYRLKKNNTSYQALYDNVREDLARHYLSKSELPASAISERLHFNDTAAFSNFFRARIGCSPRAYLKRLKDQENG